MKRCYWYVSQPQAQPRVDWATKTIRLMRPKVNFKTHEKCKGKAGDNKTKFLSLDGLQSSEFGATCPRR